MQPRPLGLLLLTLLWAPVVRADDRSECQTNGREIGALHGELFCRSLEARFRGEVWGAYANASVDLCERQIADACREAMAEKVTSMVLCSWLVALDWDDSAAKLEGFKDVACPYPVDERVACPEPSEVYAEVWCHTAADGRYLAYWQGSWWRFITVVNASDGTRYLLEASDGAQALARPDELAKVRI